MHVSSPAEFSLSQIWVISGAFGNDLNTIEAGWQVSPHLYGDNSPRFFTYWTDDAYQETGCYNLHCSGFMQTSSRVAIGAAISPVSTYAGRQFGVTLLIWKDPRRGHWWLQLGSGSGGHGGALVGYWPSALFTHLGSRANMVSHLTPNLVDSHNAAAEGCSLGHGGRRRRLDSGATVSAGGRRWQEACGPVRDEVRILEGLAAASSSRPTPRGRHNP